MNLTQLAKNCAYTSVAAILGFSVLMMPVSAQSSSDVDPVLSGGIRVEELKLDENGKPIIGLVLGDSNSTEYVGGEALWINQINNKLTRNSSYSIKNLSRGGAMVSNIEESNEYVDPFLGEYELAQLEAIGYVPNLIIFLGTNDALMEISAQDFKSNYISFIDKVLSIVKTDRLVVVAPSGLAPLTISIGDGVTVEPVTRASSKISKQIKRYIHNIKKDSSFVKTIRSHGLKKNNVRVLNPDVFGVKEIWDHVHLDPQSHSKIARRINKLMIVK
jgi:lysophospholipase L1-like esterase